MDFNMIAPMPVTDAELLASNIAEDDHPEWQAADVYEAGTRVISSATHRIYESVIGNNQGQDPRSDDGSRWLDIAPTNLWCAFDQRRSNPARRADEISFSIVPTRDCDAIALFGLSAGSVEITVWDGADEIWREAFVLSATTHVTGPYTWFFGGLVFARHQVVNGFPGYIGHRVEIVITGQGSTVEVGHIVLGRNHVIGRVLNKPNLKFVSHSRKGYDDYGNEILVKRGSTRRLDLSLEVPSHEAPRIMDVVDEVDGLATAFYVTGDAPSFGLEGLGFVDDHSQPIDVAGASIFPLTLKTLK